MHANGTNGEESRFAQMLGTIRSQAAPLDAALRQRLKADSEEAFVAADTVPGAREPWRLTRPIKRLFPLAAAASIAAGIAIAFGLWGPVGGGLAFAQVMENIHEAEILSYRVTTTVEGGPAGAVQCLHMTPGRMRFTAADAAQDLGYPYAPGSVWIMDMPSGEGIVLDPTKKKAVRIDFGAVAEMSPLPNMLQELRSLRSGDEKALGARDVDGRSLTGFQVRRLGQVWTVWAEPTTALPVLIEADITDKAGQQVRFVITDINFGAAIDRSLFDLEAPDGYAVTSLDSIPAAVSARRSATRALSAVNLDKLGKGCLQYARDNGGEWPESLEQLVGEYGITAEHLIRPRQPLRERGYEYLKPTVTPVDPDRLVIYEAHEEWPDGINVVFGNGHVKVIKEQNEFKAYLAKVAPAQ